MSLILDLFSLANGKIRKFVFIDRKMSIFFLFLFENMFVLDNGYTYETRTCYLFKQSVQTQMGCFIL